MRGTMRNLKIIIGTTDGNFRYKREDNIKMYIRAIDMSVLSGLM